jgi:hypothetical protein
MAHRLLVRDKELRLPPRESVTKTNDLDQGLGWVARLRLRAVAAALEGRRVDRLLEVGYGSGVFLPELARHCDALYGIDLHQNAPAVETSMRAQGVDARLLSASEHCVGELLRVTRPGGAVLAVTPGKSALLDFGLKIMTGETGEDTFEGRRGTIVPAFERLGRVERIVRLPRVVHKVLPLYAVVVASPK